MVPSNAMPKEPKKRGPRPERLVIAPNKVGAVIEKLLSKPPKKARKSASR